MNRSALITAALIFGIQFGWREFREGETEYIVQIDDQIIEALRNGEPITSNLPPELRNVKRIRIQYGNEPVQKPRLSYFVNTETNTPNAPANAEYERAQPATDPNANQGQDLGWQANTGNRGVQDVGSGTRGYGNDYSQRPPGSLVQRMPDQYGSNPAPPRADLNNPNLSTGNVGLTQQSAPPLLPPRTNLQSNPRVLQLPPPPTTVNINDRSRFAQGNEAPVGPPLLGSNRGANPYGLNNNLGTGNVGTGNVNAGNVGSGIPVPNNANPGISPIVDPYRSVPRINNTPNMYPGPLPANRNDNTGNFAIGNQATDNGQLEPLPGPIRSSNGEQAFGPPLRNVGNRVGSSDVADSSNRIGTRAGDGSEANQGGAGREDEQGGPGGENDKSASKLAANDDGDKAKGGDAWLFTFFLLCLSMGGNVYLGWVARGSYLRYRELSDRNRRQQYEQISLT